MLERFFDCPVVLRRLHANPLGELLEEYTSALYSRGYLRDTLRSHVWALEHFGSWIHSQRLSIWDVNKALVHSFLLEHLPRCHCPAQASVRLRYVRPALNHLLRLLDGRIHPAASAVTLTPLDAVIEQYRLHLRDSCGFAEATWLARIRYAREFLQATFGKRPIRWSKLRPDDVLSFVADYAKRCRPTTAQVAASALRSFLRFLQFRGWCKDSLVAAVPRIPNWRLASLPKTMTDEQRSAFLATFDRATATGQRDYAMALCQVELGLRVSEVAGLYLDDIDWRTATLRLGPGKVGRARELPLPAPVGQALAQYLRRSRPVTSFRNVFIRHRCRRGQPVSSALIKGIMCLAYVKVPGGGRWAGTHILRHTAATRMLQRGVNLKEIADVLGHRSLDTTTLYAKVDLTNLATVALPWPEAQQ